MPWRAGAGLGFFTYSPGGTGGTEGEEDENTIWALQCVEDAQKGPSNFILSVCTILIMRSNTKAVYY